MYKLTLVSLFLLPSISFATVWDATPQQVDHIQQVVIAIADKYGADRGVMMVIIEQESRYNCLKPGDHGTSFGCVQIHLPAHPNITRRQAENIYFAIDYLASELIKGNCWQWTTCPLSSKVDT